MSEHNGDRIVALRAKPSKFMKSLKPTLHEYNKKQGDKGIKTTMYERA